MCHGVWLFCLLALLCVAGYAIGGTTKVAAGSRHAVAIAADGSVLVWGTNGDGQLGTGESATVWVPRRIPFDRNIIAMSTRIAHGLALAADGKVYGWGNNGSGQLGNDSMTSTPVPTLSLMMGAIDVAAGGDHSLALSATGKVFSWGQNHHGELGLGSLHDEHVPREVGGLPGIAAIVAGEHFSLALDHDGHVWAWGENRYGQIGNRQTQDQRSPVRIEGLPAIRGITASPWHVLAVGIDGSLWGWGYNCCGQLTHAAAEIQTVPLRLTDAANVSFIAAGTLHSLMATTDGRVFAWGDNHYGQSSDVRIGETLPVPTEIASNVKLRSLSAGWKHTAAVLDDGSLWTLGQNANGQGGGGQYDSGLGPRKLSGLPAMRNGLAGSLHGLALDESGSMWSWGDNSEFQLGYDSTPRQNAAVRLTLNNIAAVSAGGFHSLALRRDNTLVAWGNNVWGQLGTSKNGPSLTPDVVSLPQTPLAVSAGQVHSLALLADGTIAGWGRNIEGQLGEPQSASFPVSRIVPGIDDVARIFACEWHSAALRNDGSLWVWGDNRFGQLGFGESIAQAPAPTRLTSLPARIVDFSSRSMHSMALTSDGAVWIWGDNRYGQIGNGSKKTVWTPQRVADLTDITAVAAGAGHSLALKTDGTVLAWGWNSDGQIGNGQFTDQLNPTAVIGLTNVVAIWAGERWSLALRGDGSLVSWGSNNYGQLGDGTFATRSQAMLVIDAATNALDLDGDGQLSPDSSSMPPFPLMTHRAGDINALNLKVDIFPGRPLLGQQRALPKEAAPESEFGQRTILSPPVLVKAPQVELLTLNGAGARLVAGVRAGPVYNIYVAASIVSSLQVLLFQLDAARGWNALSWPMGEFLRGVALDSQDSVVRAQILDHVDMSALGGGQIHLGYGLDPDEMLSSGRFRTIFTVPKD